MNFVGQRIKQFSFIVLLGKGAWASVYEALDERNKSTVAIKVIRKKLLEQTPKLQELIKSQIKVLKACNSTNVIKYVDSFHNNNYIFIAFQYCNGGDLQQYLKLKKNLSEDQAKTFLKQILNGFKGLHEVNAMHRDFKLANVMLHNSECKVADLGFSKQMEKRCLTDTFLGTPLTMAPEVLEGKPYGYQADIWSLGVVFYQMLFGQYPYSGKNDWEILQQMKNNRPDFSKIYISANARDFLERCLTIDPKTRISWKQIYLHTLFAERNCNFIYGTLKSRISIKQNKNFYEKNELKNDPNPNLHNIKIEKVNDIQSINMQVAIQEAQKKKKKQDFFQIYQKQYLHKRNDIMFILKFVSSFALNFTANHGIKNHGIAMFILSKNSYIEMTKFHNQLEKEKNIFRMTKYFNEFVQNDSYKNLKRQVESDIQIIGAQCNSYSCDLKYCNNEITQQFDLCKIASKNWDQLVKETISQYWFLLAEKLQYMKDESKRDLIVVLQALSYFKNNKQIKAQEFDYMMTKIDFGDAEKEIEKQYQSVFQ